jgi:hypothetical protein
MSFDLLAPFYQFIESVSVGGLLQRCRTAFLDEIPAPRRVLLAGEGHGRFLTECARRFPDARIVVVDASERMLGIAKRRCGAARVEFVHADLRDWAPEDSEFDLIVTNFFLDCFPADVLEVIVGRLAMHASEDAHWLLADFQVSSRRLERLRCRVILALLYRFFRITCGLQAVELISPDSCLEQAGFRLGRRMTFDWGLLKSEWWHRPGRMGDPDSDESES